MHSLGVALRGYLQDLPSPVVPVSVHGDILHVLQGKGFPWPRLGMGGGVGRTRLGYQNKSCAYGIWHVALAADSAPTL